MSTATLKETPLADAHRKLGARMVDFAGWNMPVQYKSIVVEHTATRTKAGLFDVSHMGEFIVTGDGAFNFIQYLIANDLSKLTEPNRAIYSQLVMPDGGTVDDLIVYRRAPGTIGCEGQTEENYLVIVNASNIDKDWKWFNEHKAKFPSVKLENVSDNYGLLAIQGPEAVKIFAKLAGSQVESMKSFTYGEATIDGVIVGFGRTGYTGEDGFEIVVPANKLEWLWTKLLETGKDAGLEPCGLGARDTLRLESALPLYGHELEADISPIQAGLGWSVKVAKGDFLGCEALKKQIEGGVKKKIVCLKAEGKALPRQGYKVTKDGKEVGLVTSGSQGIHVGYPIAFALIDSDQSEIGTKLQIVIRDTAVDATVVKRPFYKRA